MASQPEPEQGITATAPSSRRHGPLVLASVATLGLLFVALIVLGIANRANLMRGSDASRAVPTAGQDATGATSSGDAGARPTHGEIVYLSGTPHYWVADEAGVLHWPSDTRVLVGRYVRWDRVREVSVEELMRLSRGEAWLPEPVAFVRAEDGALSLVKWETGMRWPVLLRLPPLATLAPFGITQAQVDARTQDQETWERLNDLRLDESAIDFTPLPTTGSVLPAGSALAFGWRAATFSGTGAQVYPADTYPVLITLTRPKPDPYLGVVVGSVDYPSFPCGGPIGLLAVSADWVELTERFNTGLERCTDQGRVTLERRSDLHVYYLWALPGDEISVTGFLLRQD